jgi:hypothetical protein
MSTAQFSLVGKVPVTVTRHSAGSFVEGDWVEGTAITIIVNANVQPFSDYQVMMLAESDRTKNWVLLFTSDMMRSKKEGSSGYGADHFVWDGDTYEVMRTNKWSMRVVDHYEVRAVRIELTPN